MTLEERFLRGEARALARGITLLESGDPRGRELLRALRRRGGARARVVGVTGPPGSGKSTLVDRLIEAARAAGRRVAVVAVDPSSPFTGGAILGDRIRMTRWHADEGVYVRSMAARGHLGGLAGATLQVVALVEAFGFDDVVVETVGVGQSEVEIVGVADTTVVVLTPGQGDGVQAVKAGLMEIADVFVVNKADQDGAERLSREVRGMLQLAPRDEGAWLPPIVQAVASEGRGVDAVAEALAQHRAHLEAAGLVEERSRARARSEVRALVAAALARAQRELGPDEVDAVRAGARSPEELAEAVLARAAGGATSTAEAAAPRAADAGAAATVTPGADRVDSGGG